MPWYWKLKHHYPSYHATYSPATPRHIPLDLLLQCYVHWKETVKAATECLWAPIFFKLINMHRSQWNFMFFSQRLLSFAEICLKPCAWLVYLTDICHLWLVATSCEWCSCTDIGYLCVSHQLSVDVASESNCHCHNGTNLLAFPWHIHKTECFTLHCCWVFGTSGMWDRVAGLVVPDISQDCSIFIFKVAYSNEKSPFTLWPL